MFDHIARAQPSAEYLSQDRGRVLIDVPVLFIVLETVFFAAYAISKYAHRSKLGWDFWCYMPLGYVFNILSCVLAILMVTKGGAGRHVEYLALTHPEKIMTFLKIRKITEVTYLISVTFPKLAVLYLYQQVFSTPRYRKTILATTGLVVIYFIVCFVLIFAACRPFAFNWDYSIPGGKCYDIMSMYRYVSIANIVFDLIILALPMPGIYKLHVKRPVKIGLFVTFAIGSVGIVTAIIRMYEFFAVDLVSDPTYGSTRAMLWCVIEGGTYFMAACMPSLRPLKRIMFKDKSFSSAISSIYERLSPRSFSRTGGSRSWKTSSSGVIRTTEIAMEVGLADSDGRNTGSTSHINPRGAGFSKLEDVHHSISLHSGSTERL